MLVGRWLHRTSSGLLGLDEPRCEWLLSVFAAVHKLAGWCRHHWYQMKAARQSHNSSLIWRLSGGINSWPISGQQSHLPSSAKDSRLTPDSTKFNELVFATELIVGDNWTRAMLTSRLARDIQYVNIFCCLVWINSDEVRWEHVSWHSKYNNFRPFGSGWVRDCTEKEQLRAADLKEGNEMDYDIFGTVNFNHLWTSSWDAWTCISFICSSLCELSVRGWSHQKGCE